MTIEAASHCLHIFFADMRRQGPWPLLYEKQEEDFRHITKLQAAARIRDIAHAMQAMDIPAQSRVALYAQPSIELWLAEWAVLTARHTAVIIPRSFHEQELLETLAETKSKVVFVDRLVIAHMLAEKIQLLPDLMLIVCLEETVKYARHLISLNAFAPAKSDDHTADMKPLLAAITPEDMALLFYYSDENGTRHAVPLSHAKLLKDVRNIDKILAYQSVIESTAIAVKYKYKGSWRKTTSYSQTVQPDPDYIRPPYKVMAATPWEHFTGHVTAYYIAVFKMAYVQIVRDVRQVQLRQYHADIIIGADGYFNELCEQVTAQIRASGKLRWKIFIRFLELSRTRYESTEKFYFLGRMQSFLFSVMLKKKIVNMFGDRLRMLIAADDSTHYNTKIFFYMLGFKFVELPSILLSEK